MCGFAVFQHETRPKSSAQTNPKMIYKRQVILTKSASLTQGNKKEIFRSLDSIVLKKRKRESTETSYVY